MLKSDEYYDLATDIVEQFATRNDEIKSMLDMTNLDWKLKNEVEGAVKVLDSTPYVAVEHAVGVLTKNVPTVVVELAAEDFLDSNQLDTLDDAILSADFAAELKDAREGLLAGARGRADAAAEKLENILKGIFRATQDDQQVNLIAEQVRWLVRAGSFAIRTLYNGPKPGDTSTETQPKKSKNAHCRYVIQVRDPQFVFPKMGPFGPIYVAEKYDRFAAEVYAAWPAARGKIPHVDKGGRVRSDKPAEPNEKVSWLEYWDDEVKCFWANGALVHRATHNYGFLPYIYHEGHSFLYPLFKGNIWRTANQLKSMACQHTLEYVNSAWLITTEDGQEIEIDTTPGARNFKKPNELVEPLRRGELPLDIMALMNQVETQSQMIAFPSGAYGQLQEGSGYANFQALHAMEAKLLGPIAVSTMAWQRVFQNISALLKQFPPKDLRIYGITDRQGRKVPMFRVNGSDDIPDRPIIEVVMKPMLPQDRMQLASLASMLLDKGLMSRESLQTQYLEIESEQEENQRIREDLTSMSAEVQKVYATSAALMAQAEEEPKVWAARLAAAKQSLEYRKELAQIEQQLQMAALPPSPPGLMQPGMEQRPIAPQELKGGEQPPAPEMPLPSPDVLPMAMQGQTPVPPDGGETEFMRAEQGGVPPRPPVS